MNEYELRSKADKIEQLGDFFQAHALKRGKQGSSSFCPTERSLDAYRIGLDLFFYKIGFSEIIKAEQIATGDISLKQGFFDRFYIFPPILQLPEDQVGDDNSSRKISYYDGSQQISPTEESQFISPLLRKDNDPKTNGEEYLLADYERMLDQFRRFTELGVFEAKEYHSYAQGALLAVSVWEWWARKSLNYFRELSESQVAFDNERQKEIGKKIREVARKQVEAYNAYLEALSIEKEDLLGRLRKSDTDFTPEELRRLKFYRWLREQGKIEG